MKETFRVKGLITLMSCIHPQTFNKVKPKQDGLSTDIQEVKQPSISVSRHPNNQLQYQVKTSYFESGLAKTIDERRFNVQGQLTERKVTSYNQHNQLIKVVTFSQYDTYYIQQETQAYTFNQKQVSYYDGQGNLTKVIESDYQYLTQPQDSDSFAQQHIAIDTYKGHDLQQCFQKSVHRDGSYAVAYLHEDNHQYQDVWAKFYNHKQEKLLQIDFFDDHTLETIYKNNQAIYREKYDLESHDLLEIQVNKNNQWVKFEERLDEQA